MQLNPNQSFSTQVKNLKGSDFEKIVAASLYYSGYQINRNLILGVKKETVAEIDIVATLITPLNEIKIAIECKGANPSFNDLRKFSSIRNLLSFRDYFVELIIFGANNTRKEHLDVAKLLDIQLLKKSDLSKLVLPILWEKGDLRKQRITWINRYLAIYSIEDFYFNDVINSISDKVLRKKLTGYKKYLFSDLWSINDPIEQLDNSFEKATNDYKNFIEDIAKELNTTAIREVKKPQNQIVQAAMLLELHHRIANLYAIARCSIIARTKQGREVLTERTPRIRKALNRLCDYNLSPQDFMNFITRFIFLWGGVILKEKENGVYKDVHQLAKETGISDENAMNYLGILILVYGSGQSLFIKNKDIFFLKYVPSAYRALGIKHRTSVYKNYDKKLFNNDAENEKILKEVVQAIPGDSELLFEK